MRRWIEAALLLCVLVPLLGCGTIASSSRSWPAPDPMGGTREDLGELTYEHFHLFGVLFAAIDLPFSFAADIVLLPVNLLWFLNPFSPHSVFASTP